MRPQFKTLEELRENLAVSLGFGAVPGAIDLQIPILTQFLQQAQQQLWRDVRWQHLLRTHIEPLGVAQRVLDVPDDFSVGKVEQVYRRQGGGWQKLTQGFPVFMDGERKGPPEFYEVSARFDGRHAQIEFWPLPQELVAMRIDYYAVPQRFTHNNDRASVPDDLLLALALVTGIRIDAGGGIPLGAVLAFPAAVQNPAGYLKADGSTFDQATYPDLYAALGNSNKLPDLRHDSIGMMAWCPTDTPPEGWLPCDGRTINQDEYPELYAYLGSRYGAAGKLPEAQDRYIRNAGNGLTVGQLQDDEIKRHVHKFISSDVTGSDALAVVRSDLFEQDDDAPDQLQHSDIIGDGAWGDNGWAQPKLTSPYATGGDETRPKTIVLKLCIKARSGRGDVSYWVRAYGAVSNAGSLDAAALAAGLQGKSDKGHTHTAAEITDLQAAVAAMTVNQRIGQFEVVKLPDGTLIQAGTVRVQNHLNSAAARILTWPLTFAAAPVVAATVAGSRPDVRDALVTIDTAGSSQSALQYWIHEATYNTPDVTIHFIGIGRWRT